MAGFSNDVLIASNVNFSGDAAPAGKLGTVLVDGEMLIGATATPNIRVGTITSTNGTITVTPGPGTLNIEDALGDNRFPITPYVVGPVGVAGYQTIQDGLDAANADGGGIVYVQPGTYTEDLTLYEDTQIVGTPSSSNSDAIPDVIIVGTTSASYTGTSAIKNVRLQTPSNLEYAIEMTGSNATKLYVENCYIDASLYTAINASSINVDSLAYFYNCMGHAANSSQANFFLGTTTGTLTLDHCNFTNLNTNNITNAISGTCNIIYSTFTGLLGPSAGTLNISYSTIDSTLFSFNTLSFANGLGITANLYYSTFISGSAGGAQVAIGIGTGNTVTAVGNTIYSPNATAISVNGTLNFTPFSFTGPGSGVSGAGTINALPFGPLKEMRWSAIGASQTLAVQNGYFCTSGAGLSLALPATSEVGDRVRVVLDGSTSWTITQPNAGTQIRMGNTQTTLGVGGSLASTAVGDSVELVCETANARWAVVSSIGNITIV